MNKSLPLYLSFKLLLELSWYGFCSAIPCKTGVKALFPLLGYKCEDFFFFFFKSHWNSSFEVNRDLLIYITPGSGHNCLWMQSKVCHSWLLHQDWTALQARVGVLSKGLFDRVVLFFFSFLSNQHFYSQYPLYKNKRWNPVPVDSILVLPFYSKFLTLK